MEEVLSQQEIDALLSAISAGEIETTQALKEVNQHKVRYYDFRRPNKFSKDLINILKLIHENYARIMSNSLSSQLRTNILIKVMSIDQVTYEEFIRSTPNPTLLMTLKMPPLKGVILFDLNLEIAFQIIEFLCGGKKGGQIKPRALTEIEKNIFSEITSGFLDGMALAWQDVMEVSPSVESIDDNPQLNQNMSPTESVAIVTFSIEVAGTLGFANLCIPYLAIEKVLDRLNVRHWYETYSQDQNTEYEKAIEERLLNCKLELSVLLGKTNITVREFMDLSKGDVVQLDKPAGEPLKMFVEGKLHFLVQPGICKNQLSVQVIDCIGRDGEQHE